MTKAVVLCVDDEGFVLDSIKSQVRRRLGETFMVEAMTSAEEALDFLTELQEEAIEVPVVISDHIMPGMKGDEFLIAVHARFPNTLTVLLTGQASPSAIGNAVNFARLYRYIPKPWDEVDLQLTISEAVRSFYQDKQLAIQNRELKELNENLEHLVEKRTEELSNERERSERLLLNILPDAIAQRLKSGDTIIADSFDAVSVIFVDIVGFTQLTSQLKALELIELLNKFFIGIDQIATITGFEKIKTIGDSYMAVVGLPLADPLHALNAVKSALAMMEVGRSVSASLGRDIRFRIGMHCGPVVAGVIGERKFSYDVWGDTVNIAARMEKYGEPAKIQVSEDFLAALIEQSGAAVATNTVPSQIVIEGATLKVEARGEIDVKGKGMMKTYFINPV